jgi:hypothetical protein
MKFIKENLWWMGTLLIAAIAITSLFVLAYKDTQQYNEWYNSLTPAEKEIYEIQKQQAYESRIKRYEIASVHKYVKNVTNNFGGVVRTEVCYSFTYIDGNNLCHVDNFQHFEYGLTKVILGDKDLYIINNNGETTRTLQLTKETLANMQSLN